MSKALPVADVPEPVLLIIADISGYTRYMTANAKTLAHSQTIITELVKGIIEQIELPLEVAKLEGDAVFLFCRKQQDPRPWTETKQVIGTKLLSFFQTFSQKVGELSQSTTCTCNACTHIEKLRLKVVAHSGEALFHRVLNFVELAGVDVIIAHRLLKNSIEADQYLLLTEPAGNDVTLPSGIQLVKGIETYEDIGQVNTLMYRADGGSKIAGSAVIPFSERFGRAFKWYWRLWLAALRPKRTKFRHIESGSGKAARAVFGLVTILLTPIFLPVSAMFILARSLKPSAGRNQMQHSRAADGSCCHKH